MLARHEGQVVLVAGALPGERVLVQVDRTSRQVAFANVTEVLNASPHRRHEGLERACGGSVFAYIAYDHQLELKTAILADTLSRIGRLRLDQSIPIASSPQLGYRMRARFHVDGHRIGFFKEGTHQLCDPAPTGQLLPGTIEALGRLTARLGDEGWRGVTAVELAENVPASERVLQVEVRDDQALSRCGALTAGDGFTGLTVARADRPDRRIVNGVPTVTDRLSVPSAGRPSHRTEATIVRHAHAFFQANRHLLSLLIERVAMHVPVAPVVDLYAGVGLFAVSLAAGGWPRVVAVEGDRASATDLQVNAKPFGSVLRTSSTSVEAFVEGEGLDADAVVIVDPPRTGLSKEATRGIIAERPSRLVYVSCDPATLARDLRAFSERGYRLEHLEAFDLFPNTAHIETLAVLVR